MPVIGRRHPAPGKLEKMRLPKQVEAASLCNSWPLQIYQDFAAFVLAAVNAIQYREHLQGVLGGHR